MSHNLRPGQFSLHGVKEIRFEYDTKYRMIDVKFVSEHEHGEMFADVFTLQAWRDSEYGQPRQFPDITVVNDKTVGHIEPVPVLPPPSMVEYEDKHSDDPVLTMVNNYQAGLYQDGEVWIQTDPAQLNNNNGRVYLTVHELRRLLAIAIEQPSFEDAS